MSQKSKKYRFKERRPLVERFEEKYIPEPNSGCWIWTASSSKGGYGAMTIGGRNGRAEKAHRISYQIYKGNFDKSLDVCHKCDNPSCVNPDHLFLGTHQDNMKDMQNKGRRHNHIGELHGMAILTQNDILEIRSSNLPQRKLAAQYGVAQSQIWRIKNNKSWSHVT